MSEHFNGLTPAEAELLAILSEECAEVIQIVGKILRHGLLSVNPDKPEEGTNIDRLERELGDVRAAKLMLFRYGVIDVLRISNAVPSRLGRLEPWLHHASVDGPK